MDDNRKEIETFNSDDHPKYNTDLKSLNDFKSGTSDQVNQILNEHTENVETDSVDGSMIKTIKDFTNAYKEYTTFTANGKV